MYHFLKEAYGPLAGFLFGWGSFLVIMSGGIAALAAGLASTWAGSSRSSRRNTSSPPFRSGPVRSWKLTGGGVAGVLAIAFLTAVNFAGVKEGAWVQNLVTILKIGSLAALAGVGLFVAAPVRPDLGGSAPAGRARPLRRRDDFRPVGLRRLVLLRSLGGRGARSRPQHPARTDRRDRGAHRDLRIDQFRLSAGASDSRPLSDAPRRRSGGAGAPGSGGGATRLRGDPRLDLRLSLRQHPHLLAHLSADGAGRALLPVAREDQPAPSRARPRVSSRRRCGRASSSSPGPSSSFTPMSSSSRSSPMPRPEPRSTSCAARIRRLRAPTGPGAIRGCRRSSSSPRSR